MIKVLSLVIQINLVFGWRYQTKCTRHLSAFNHNMDAGEYNSIIEDFERDIFYENEMGQSGNKLRLKCANVNDFLFIGQTKYGVSAAAAPGDTCSPSHTDCQVTVDYIANQCNGLNSCDIALDAQFLHSCKNNSDYVSIAYECIPGSQKIDICSNDETFIIDSSFAKSSKSNSLSRFGSFYLTSPEYPTEYKNYLNNCSCKMEYVKIDSNTEPSGYARSQMNLVFRSYEFDVEESIGDVCQKDYFRIKSGLKELSMCGQQKRFKEVYSTGSKFSLDFRSDDVITRRGFLIKVSTQPETYCPFSSTRFSSNKCIKQFGDNEQNSYRLDWFEASKSCASLNGRIVSIKDFVDDLRIEPFLAQGVSYWSRRHNESKCYTKTSNAWSEESCTEKHAFVCEFEPLVTKQREKLIAGLSDNTGNRLIRVACGASSSIFSSSSLNSETTSRKSPHSNSIKNTQRPTKQTPTTTTMSSSASKAHNIITVQEYLPITPTYKIALKDHSTKDKADLSIGHDLVLIIGVACGVSIVLIAINVFCLWNYLSKKIKDYYEKKSSDVDQQTYRSSTISRSNKSANRTFTSSVDSYAKVPPFDLEHMSACESLSSSGSELAYGSNKPPNHHYYETLNKQNNQWNNYAEYNPINRMHPFESMVVMPCGTISSNYMTAVRPVPINPTVVLLKQLQPQQHQQQVKLNEQEQYSCVVYGELSPASSSSGSTNQPLITFSSSSSGVSAI